MAQWAEDLAAPRGLQFDARKPCGGEGTGSTKLSSDVHTASHPDVPKTQRDGVLGEKS